MSQALIEALQNPTLFDHPVERFQVLETHISWVLLTGPFAYKIKKPMDFGFLNFATLERRKHFCEQEVRLNQRLAPELYLATLPISGSPQAPRLNDASAPFEYAIKMAQFDQSQLLNALQADGKLTLGIIDELACLVADFHQRIDSAPADSRFGAPPEVLAPVRQNFEQIRPLLQERDDLLQLERLEAWANDAFARLQPLFEQRKAAGMIKECHGDIHLGNVALYNGKVTLFDCIEFNDELRWIDVMSEVAFTVMDLEDRGLTPFARHFLNRYLELTGDYAGLKVLDFYKAYRAMVRAKVGLFRLGQPGLDAAEQADILAQYRSYVALAERYTEIPTPYLLVTCGVSGSGKSTLSEQLVSSLGLIRLRSDVERKRLFQLPPQADSQSPLDGGIYTADASERTYQRLVELAAEALRAGYPVVVDATCLERRRRQQFCELAQQQGVPFLVLACEVDEDEARQRIHARQQQGGDASEAGIGVLERQLRAREPIAPEERAYTLAIDTTKKSELKLLAARIRRQLGH